MEKNVESKEVKTIFRRFSNYFYSYEVINNLQKKLITLEYSGEVTVLERKPLIR